MMFQQDAVFPWMTVAQNIGYGPRIHGASKAECIASTAQWVELVGLKGFEGAWPRELSGGMRKRVDIGRVYPTPPSWLFTADSSTAPDSTAVTATVTIPTTILIDSEGRERGRVEGAVDWIAQRPCGFRPAQPNGDEKRSGERGASETIGMRRDALGECRLAAPDYRYTELPPPLPDQAFTAQTVTGNGAIVASYTQAGGSKGNHGYIRDPQGQVTTFDVPKATVDVASSGTMPIGMNEAGTISGFFMGPDGQHHGFLRTPSGQFTVVDHPNAVSTALTRINAASSVAGDWIDGAANTHGFIISPGGRLPPDRSARGREMLPDCADRRRPRGRGIFR